MREFRPGQAFPVSPRIEWVTREQMELQAELKAMKQVMEALEILDLDACKRVLDYGLTWAEQREQRRLSGKEGAPLIEDISHR